MKSGKKRRPSIKLPSKFDWSRSKPVCTQYQIPIALVLKTTPVTRPKTIARMRFNFLSYFWLSVWTTSSIAAEPPVPPNAIRTTQDKMKNVPKMSKIDTFYLYLKQKKIIVKTHEEENKVEIIPPLTPACAAKKNARVIVTYQPQWTTNLENGAENLYQEKAQKATGAYLTTTGFDTMIQSSLMGLSIF